MLTIDYGTVQGWKQGDMIMPLPASRVYINCFLQDSKKGSLQKFFMQDQHFFILLRPNFSNPTQIRGLIDFKVKHKQVIELYIEKAEPRSLLVLLAEDGKDALTEVALLFEDRKKCQEAKEFVELRRDQQLSLEGTLVEKLLLSQSEAEQQLFS